MSAQELEPILAQVRRLSHEDQLRLIECVQQILAAATGTGASRNLVYGKYRNGFAGRMSSEEDFELAEWRPGQKDLNGP